MKWNIEIETLQKWSHEIVYYWETRIPITCQAGSQGRRIKSKEYKSKRIALISWKKFAEDNGIDAYAVIDAHNAVMLS